MKMKMKKSMRRRASLERTKRKGRKVTSLMKL